MKKSGQNIMHGHASTRARAKSRYIGFFQNLLWCFSNFGTKSLFTNFFIKLNLNFAAHFLNIYCLLIGQNVNQPRIYHRFYVYHFIQVK
jgi:hypothetical protein